MYLIYIYKNKYSFEQMLILDNKKEVSKLINKYLNKDSNYTFDIYKNIGLLEVLKNV